MSIMVHGRTPVVLVPGALASRLTYSYDDQSVSGCIGAGVDEDAWMNLTTLLTEPGCLMQRLEMRWNTSSNSWENRHGVTVKVVAGIDGVEYLDGPTSSRVPYYHPLIDFLERNLSFIRNVNLVAAPYDFRVGAKGLDAWRQSLADTIESFGEPVLLISHSMGCMEAAFFLSLRDDGWKKTHIRGWIAAGGSFLGVPRLAKAILHGDDLHVPGLTAENAHSYETHVGELLLAMPLPLPGEWNGTYRVTVNETGASYDASTVPIKLLPAFGLDGPYSAESKVFPGVLRDAGVNVKLVYGSAVPTPVAFHFLYANFTDEPEMTMGDGDGSVPVVSSTYPLRHWANVEAFELKGVSHVELIQNEVFFRLVAAALDLHR